MTLFTHDEIKKQLLEISSNADVELPDIKGSVYLLPTVSAKEAVKHYPGYHLCNVPSRKNYLHVTKKKQVESVDAL